MGFLTSVFANGVTIRETNGNGFVTQINLIEDDGDSDPSNDVEHIIWPLNGEFDLSLPGEPVEFFVSFPTTSFLVKGVRIFVDIDHDQSTWEEIDAVLLQGSTIIPPIINTYNGGLGGGIQVRETLVLAGHGNDTADDPSHDFTTPTHVDTLTSVSDDTLARGPITLVTDVSIDSRTDSAACRCGRASAVRAASRRTAPASSSWAAPTPTPASRCSTEASSTCSGYRPGGRGQVSEVQTVTVGGTAGTFS